MPTVSAGITNAIVGILMAFIILVSHVFIIHHFSFDLLKDTQTWGEFEGGNAINGRRGEYVVLHAGEGW
jgi:hypothetical protein